MKRLLKNALLGALSPMPLRNDQAVILMYHSVHPDSRYFMNVPPSAFKRHMAHIARKGKAVIPLRELVRRLQNAEPLAGAVVITFDDGYEDNMTEAFPVLRQYGFPATIFVTTGLIGAMDKRGLKRLSEPQLQELQGSGLIDIEPHTRSHPRLAQLSFDEAKAEVLGSKLELEHILQRQCAIFAYPYGSKSAEAERAIMESGYRAAVTVEEGIARNGDNPFRLKRVSIDSSTTPMQFRGKLSRGIDIYERSKHLVHL